MALTKTNLKSGYYLILDKKNQPELAGLFGREEAMGAYDLGSIDSLTGAIAFMGSNDTYDLNDPRFEIVRWVCDPWCSELIPPKGQS